MTLLLCSLVAYVYVYLIIEGIKENYIKNACCANDSSLLTYGRR